MTCEYHAKGQRFCQIKWGNIENIYRKSVFKTPLVLKDPDLTKTQALRKEFCSRISDIFSLTLKGAPRGWRNWRKYAVLNWRGISQKKLNVLRKYVLRSKQKVMSFARKFAKYATGTFVGEALKMFYERSTCHCFSPWVNLSSAGLSNFKALPWLKKLRLNQFFVQVKFILLLHKKIWDI